MAEISTIIFDVGGVLVNDTDPLVFEKISKILKIDYESVKEAIHSFLPDLQTERIDEKEFLRLLVMELDTKVGADKLENIWTDGYAENVRKNDDVLSLARRLRSYGHKTAILSNTNPGHLKVNKALGVYTDFSPVILSCEVGARKPERRIYEIALEELGVSPEQCVFIDDKERNLAPAMELGMHTILFKDASQLESDLKDLGVTVSKSHTK